MAPATRRHRAPHAPALGQVNEVITQRRQPRGGLLSILLRLWAVAIIYYVAPDVEQELRFITPGAILAVLGWVAAALGFGSYVNRLANYNALRCMAAAARCVCCSCPSCSQRLCCCLARR